MGVADDGGPPVGRSDVDQGLRPRVVSKVRASSSEEPAAAEHCTPTSRPTAEKVDAGQPGGCGPEQRARSYAMTAAACRHITRQITVARAYVAVVVERIHDPHVVEESIDTHLDLLSQGAY